VKLFERLADLLLLRLAEDDPAAVRDFQAGS
jgi:hypothetical protein